MCFEMSLHLERLAAWISNATDQEDQKLLLEYAARISFFSHEDFVALYRTALTQEIAPWIALQTGARLDGGGKSYHHSVARAIQNNTWFSTLPGQISCQMSIMLNI